MTSRYLFRNDELIAEEHTEQQYFDGLSKQDDLMLMQYENNGQPRWAAYRMCWFADHIQWSWLPMPPDTARHLRTLLLLQKS